jgi:hypothetical protein
MSCGYEHIAPALQEAIASAKVEEIFMPGNKRQLANDEYDLLAQLSTYSRSHSAPENQQGRAFNLFRKITGKNPPRGWSIEYMPNVEISKNVQNKIRSLNIAYMKMKKAA